MASKSYRTYRGRPPRWKRPLLIVLILILAGALAFLLLQRYQVFDGDGFHFQLPSFAETKDDGEESQKKDEDYDEDLVINIIDKPENQPETEPADTPETEAEVLHGRAVPAAAAQQGDFSTLLEGERPVITLKAPNGALILDSEGTAAALTAQLKDRNAVVRVACYQDSDYAKHHESMAVMSVKGRAWGDPNGKSYLDPYSADTTAYLTELIRRSAAVGASEVLLDGVGFPTTGRTGNMVFSGQQDSPENRMNAINAFLDAAGAALGEGVELSISLPWSLLEQPKDGAAGLDLQAIAQRVDHIYMSVPDQAAADAAREKLSALCPEKDSETFLVAVTAAPITGGSYLLAG